jgi:hypothetical protein
VNPHVVEIIGSGHAAAHQDRIRKAQKTINQENTSDGGVHLSLIRTPDLSIPQPQVLKISVHFSAKSYDYQGDYNQ